jgi:RNA polymerase sigma factor (TIGR02999 family)
MAFESRIGALLPRVSAGDRAAAEELSRLVYDDLHAIAVRMFRRERVGHSLQPTILVNDALQRLLGATNVTWKDRAHFYAFAARNMRQVLLDYAKYKGAIKRKPPGERVPLDDVADSLVSPAVCIDDVSDLLGTGQPIDVAKLESVIDALATTSPAGKRQADGVILRAYAGEMTDEEVAYVLGVSESTAKEDWRFAKAWFRAHYGGNPS